MVNQKLYLCGPGSVVFTPPPGSWELDCVMSASGHLLVPITEFEAFAKQGGSVKAKEPRSFQASTSSVATSTAQTQTAVQCEPTLHDQSKPQGKKQKQRCPTGRNGNKKQVSFDDNVEVSLLEKSVDDIVAEIFDDEDEASASSR